MKRASKLFVLDEVIVGSSFVEKIWRAHSEPEKSFISVAASHAEIVITQISGKTSVTVRGPETKATISPIPQNAEFFGIQFRPGVFLPALPWERLVDSALTLPAANGRSFRLNSAVFELPNYNNADVFIERLVRVGLLVRDSLVESVLKGQASEISQRSVQRRFRRATGLTHATFKQIERAHSAVALLENGMAILDTAQRAAYADQAHLTRSLKRFIGQTPAEIFRERSSG